ncbi:hypothetical protein HN385_06895 [archaeon]|jgi:hypothetical protein|nr:hypothetical protein [archaeon]MBT3451000.1 hypothetical protein [archaeon]MBT6868580.1 hypothetical protein [archaeon]MBT7193112.1 hypothetical protein [archaeon]MBT7380429.1 hypothetical protein [archaeon]
MNKKGMEMWQIVLMILMLLLIFFGFLFYGGISDKLGDLFGTLKMLM